MSDQEKVFMSEGEDQEMNDAARKARSTFKYFWRELSWERRRVIPAHSLACVKISFGTDDTADNIPSVEHMWVGDIDYDGDIITGTLMSSPNWISNLNAGDQVTKKLEDIGDWMFSIQGKVYGGFSVNLMRSRMSPKELGEHDSAWGLDFGDPSDIQLEYRSEKKKKKGILGMFKKADSSQDSGDSPEHPMSLNMGDSLKEQLQSSNEVLEYSDAKGWGMLHLEALAGNSTSVQILLDHGADKSVKTASGYTPLDLAKKQEWGHVVAVLQD